MEFTEEEIVFGIDNTRRMEDMMQTDSYLVSDQWNNSWTDVVPTNILCLRHVNSTFEDNDEMCKALEEEILRNKLQACGEMQVRFIQHWSDMSQIVILVFRDATQAEKAQKLLEHEYSAVEFAKPLDSELLQHSLLNIPIHEKNWLSSPPASPPKGWKPIREDINHVPFTDLQAVPNSHSIVILPANNGLPEISVLPPDAETL